MAIEVFNRCEKKYLLSKKQYDELLKVLKEYMDYDVYNKTGEVYKICNIYYDTDNHDLIRKSISKPVYKEKLRVRGYGDIALGDKVFVEIKKKCKGVVNKRRTAMKLEDAMWYLEGKIDASVVIAKNPEVNRQVLKEIDYFKRINHIKPMVYLSYERMAYVAKEDKDFRVTFDVNITTRREDVALHKGSFGKKLLPEDVYLMEVKVPGAVPMWFAKCLSQLKIYPTSFSKYGTEYMIFLHEEAAKCAKTARQCCDMKQDSVTCPMNAVELHKGKEKDLQENKDDKDNKGDMVCSNQYLQVQQITQLLLAKRLSELA